MNAVFYAAIILGLSQIPRVEPVRPGAVTGRLLSTDNAPAAGIRMAAVPVAEDGDNAAAPVLLGITKTDSDGRYKLEGIPPGRYYVFAGLIDYPNYYPGATSLEKATVISVEADSIVSGLDFSMLRPTTVTVAGRIAFPSGVRPAANDVTLFPRTRLPAGTSIPSAKVDENGLFRFLQVSPGEYQLSAAIRGSSPSVVTVGDRDILDIVVPVVDCNAGVQVRGRLVGPPPSSVQSVSLAGSRTGCASATSVKPDGSFVFSNVAEGTYRVELSPIPLGWVAASLLVERTDVTNLDIQLPASVEVKGQVLIEGGGPPPRLARGAPLSIRATAVAGGRGEVTQPVLDDGTFALRLIQGRYRVSPPPVPTGYTIKSMTYGDLDLLRTDLDFDVSEIRNIEVTLGVSAPRRPVGVRLSGRLTVPDAGSFPNPEGVVLVSASSTRNASVLETAVNSDGSFEFTGVSPGRYNLETIPDSPVALYGIEVGKMDVTEIDFALPILVRVSGGVEWIDQRGNSMSGVPSNISMQFARNEGERLLVWSALVQSKDFHVYLPEGDFRFSIGDVPANFNVRSATSGSVDVLETGLRVKSTSDPLNIRVTLRAR